MDRYLLVIAVSDHIGRIHVVEPDLIKSEQYSDESDGWVPILVGLIHSKVPLVGEPWMRIE